MARRKRLFAALAVALLCAPGTWLRTNIPAAPPRDIAMAQVQGAGPGPTASWQVAGVWQYRANSMLFGGFSALLALHDHRLRAFSDRGARFTLIEPDRPEPRYGLVRQLVAPADANDLWDIEAATREPAAGTYWLAYENRHTIHRFTRASAPKGKRDLKGEVDWGMNSGAEAMVRLSQGQFVVLPEGAAEGLLFPGDPVDGVAPARFTFRNPAPGYAATDIAELPDGRLLVLMRKVEWAHPPFASLLAIGAAPQPGGTFAPEQMLPLNPTIPRENYEGLALRPRADGRIDVWLISDDNQSVLQRTLLVKLIFDPTS